VTEVNFHLVTGILIGCCCWVVVRFSQESEVNQLIETEALTNTDGGSLSDTPTLSTCILTIRSLVPFQSAACIYNLTDCD
jgi:hypothetical protein